MEDLEELYDIHDTASYILRHGYTRVALQVSHPPFVREENSQFVSILFFICTTLLSSFYE